MIISYFHLCDYAFVTDNGKLGIIGIFDRIFSKQFPTTHQSMFVVGQVTEIDRRTQSLTLIIKKGLQELAKQALVTNLQSVVSPLRSYNFLVGLHNFTFQEPGVYDFTILVDDREVGTRKLVLEKPSEG